MRPQVSVETFSDYRAYLATYAQAMRLQRPGWSLASWARRLGLKSTSSLTKVIQGQREPGTEMTERLIQYFKFTAEEAECFRDLISLNKLKRDPRLAAGITDRLRKHQTSLSVEVIDLKAFDVISNWYCYAIREMVKLDRFLEDPEWIASRLRYGVSPREAFKAIQLLLEVGLLIRDEKGKLSIQDRHIDTVSDNANEALKRHHEQMLENARVALRTIEPEEREFNSVTIAMRGKDLAKAKKAIRSFRKRFTIDFDKEKGDAIFQMQVQLFPLTRSANRSPR